MHFFKLLTRFYVDASLHVSLAVLAFIWLTAFQLNIDVPFGFYGFVCACTICCYNVLKFGKQFLVKSNVLTAFHRYIKAITLLAFLSALILVFFLPSKLIKVFAGLGLLTFLYACSLFTNYGLRNLYGFKMGIVALVWSAVSVLCPLYFLGTYEVKPVAFLFLQRFLFVLVLLSPFEIKDATQDAVQLQTLPVVLGVLPTKLVATCFALGVIVLQALVPFEFFYANMVAYLIYILSIWYVWQSHTTRSNYFTLFWVEAIPIWMVLSILFIKSVL